MNEPDKTDDLSPEALEILRTAVCGKWYVNEENLLAISDLVRAGLVRLRDDYEYIEVLATVKGERLALERGYVEVRGDDRFGHGPTKLAGDGP